MNARLLDNLRENSWDERRAFNLLAHPGVLPMAILQSLTLIDIHPPAPTDLPTGSPSPDAALGQRQRPSGLRFRQGWPDDHPEFLRIDARLAPDHIARRIDRAVSTLDLTDLFNSYGQTGSPAHSPDLLLKVVLYELYLKQRSPKLWAKDAFENDPVRWLARGLEPAPSRCYAFRQRLGPRLLEFNQQVLHDGVEQELTPATRGAQDGSTFAANASRHTLLNETSLQRRLDLLEQTCSADAAESKLLAPASEAPTPTDPVAAPTVAVTVPQPATTAQTPAAPARLSGGPLGIAASLRRADRPATAPTNPLAEPPVLPKPEVAQQAPIASESAASSAVRQPWWMAETPAGRQRQQERYRQAQKRLDERLRLNERRAKEDRLPRERVVISPGDSESIPGLDKLKVFRPLYNVQFVVDLDSPLILAYQVFAQSHDGDTFEPLLKRAEWLVGHPLKEVLGDSTYATGPNLATAEERKVRLWSPWQSNDLPESAKSGKTKQIPKEQFTWLEEKQTYQCPEGHELDFVRERLFRRNEKESQLWEYRCAAKHCQACPRQSECARNAKTGRTITRNAFEEEIADLRARMATPEGKEIYRLRKQTVEPAFADCKEHRGFVRFSGHGLTPGETEVGLTVLVHNLLTVQMLADRRATQAQRSAQTQTA
jgi:transposase